MNKLSKKEYILKAARLYGLTDFELKDLEDYLNGNFDNKYIAKRNIKLFRMYHTYISPKYNEHISVDENGIIDLDNYLFIISKRRLQDSKIGRDWLISSNLDSYLITNRHSSDINNKWIKISEKNNFLLPQIAKQLELPATIYYKGKFPEKSQRLESVFFMTKDLLKDGESLILGDEIYKRKKDRVKIDFEDLLSETAKYIKRYYKKNKINSSEAEKVKDEVRKGLIKQTIFNKLVFNNNEGNSKWGLIKQEDSTLKLAPIYSFDYCSGVESSGKSHHRVLHKKEDVETFIQEYADEEWFRKWIKEKVITLDIDKAINDMKNETGMNLTEKENEYYKFSLKRNLDRIKNAYMQVFGESDSPKRVKEEPEDEIR